MDAGSQGKLRSIFRQSQTNLSNTRSARRDNLFDFNTCPVTRQAGMETRLKLNVFYFVSGIRQ